jgi:hypothetical protein
VTDWFRSWHGAPMDPKWVLIGRKAGVSASIASAVAWALFDYASQASPRGDVSGFDCEVYAAWGGIDEEGVSAVIRVMNERGMIQDGALAKWEKRQPEREDYSSGRVKAFRERKDETKRDETHGNARNGNETHRNAPEERREDTEEKREEVISSPPAERERDATGERALEGECRKLAINLPAMADANFVPVLKLLDEGILPEDVLVAMRDIGQKNHPLRNWHGVGSWARKAAKDRLEMAMPSANYARAGPANGQKTSCSHSERRANGTPKSPSDFINEAIRQHSERAESRDSELLT